MTDEIEIDGGVPSGGMCVVRESVGELLTRARGYIVAIGPENTCDPGSLPLTSCSTSNELIAGRVLLLASSENAYTSSLYPRQYSPGRPASS